MDAWITDDDMWIRRTALLYQLRYGADTDADRLFRFCTLRMHEPDFFIRKAVGWALRTHGRHDAPAVREFVQAHRAELSPLSIREALKHIGDVDNGEAGDAGPTSRPTKRARQQPERHR